MHEALSHGDAAYHSQCRAGLRFIELFGEKEGRKLLEREGSQVCNGTNRSVMGEARREVVHLDIACGGGPEAQRCHLHRMSPRCSASMDKDQGEGN